MVCTKEASMREFVAAKDRYITGSTMLFPTNTSRPCRAQEALEFPESTCFFSGLLPGSRPPRKKKTFQKIFSNKPVATNIPQIVLHKKSVPAT